MVRRVVRGAATWRIWLAMGGLSVCAPSTFAQPSWIDACELKTSAGSPCIQPFSEGLAAVMMGSARDSSGHWGFMDRTGQVVVRPSFTEVRPFSNGLAAVLSGGLWGYIDPRGQWVIEPRYQEASPFNTRGTALVRDDHQTLLINSRGNIVKPFPPEITPYPDFAQAFRWGLALAEMQLRSPTVLWNVTSPQSISTPGEVVEVLAPQGGLFPARQADRSRASWGMIDTRGRWAALPSNLQSDRAPWHDQGVFAVARVPEPGRSEWRFVNSSGKPLSDARYRAVQWLRPGVWLVQSSQDHATLLDAKLQVLREVDSAPPHRPIEVFGPWVVLTHQRELLLVGADGVIKTFAGIERPRLQQRGGVLWVESADTRRPSGYDLALILTPEGTNLLDPEARPRLWTYSVHPIAPDDAPSNPSQPLPLARLIPQDPRQFKGILTPTGKVAFHWQWAAFKWEHGKEGPWIVRSTNGRFGAINAQGKWVVAPRFHSIQGFQDGYSWARLEGGPTGSNVLINARGRVIPLPADTGISMNTAKLGDGLVIYPASASGPGGIWDPASGNPPKAEAFDRVDGFQRGLARASKGQRWGVVDREGRWVIPPRYEGTSPDTLARLDDTVFSVSRLGPEKLYTEETHRLVSATTGQDLSADLGHAPQRLAAGRYLAQPLNGGVELIDERGQALLSDSRPALEFRSIGGWGRLSFAPRRGVIDSTGQWRSGPTALASDRPSPPATFEPPHHEGLTVYADKSKFGLMDALGQRVLPPQFDVLRPMYNGRATAQQKNRYGPSLGYVDRSGAFAIAPQFEVATDFQEGQALVKRQGVTQFIDTTGKLTASFQQICGQMAIFNGRAEQTWPLQVVSCVKEGMDLKR